jgi:hypothetical protein
MLKFSRNNRKLHSTAKLIDIHQSEIVGFDLPAGWSCPSAVDCLAKADKITGKITDGIKAKFRCYAASSESAFTSVRKLRWHNFNILRKLKTSVAMAQAIYESMPKNVKVVRIHTSGDFFNKAYFVAWIRVARAMPSVTFYGYTKQAQYLTTDLPSNMKIVVSVGGRNDDKAPKHARAHVVLTAQGHAFPVYDDAQSETAVIEGKGTFGLLIHGTQPKHVNQLVKELNR